MAKKGGVWNKGFTAGYNATVKKQPVHFKEFGIYSPKQKREYMAGLRAGLKGMPIKKSGKR